MKGSLSWAGPAVAMLMSGISALCTAADTNRDNVAADATRMEQPAGYVGVMVEDLHPAFASHFPNIGAMGQGLMVQSVSADSPAAKYGLKRHDILMMYDDQKLFSPEQFTKLVAGDKPGREVTLGIIREGKQQTLKVQLGERNWRDVRPQEEFVHRIPPRLRNAWRGSNGRHEGANQWNQFDSLTLKKMDNDKFHASIAFTDKDGKLQKHEYDGTRDELRKRIEEDKDLSNAERFHLLRSLDIQTRVTTFPFTPEDDLLEF